MARTETKSRALEEARLHSNPDHGPRYIGLISDEPLLLEGLTCIFQQHTPPEGPTLMPISGTIAEFLGWPSIEYLVVDLHRPSVGVDILSEIRRVHPSVKLMVIGPPGNDELVLESVIAGARAYLELNADAEQVWAAIKAVNSGNIWAPRRLLTRLIDRLLKVCDSSLINGSTHVTDRQSEVLEQALKGRSNREIADHLGIREGTVKAHMTDLMHKTGANNRIELSIYAINHQESTTVANIDRRLFERRKSERRGTVQQTSPG